MVLALLLPAVVVERVAVVRLLVAVAPIEPSAKVADRLTEPALHTRDRLELIAWLERSGLAFRRQFARRPCVTWQPTSAALLDRP